MKHRLPLLILLASILPFLLVLSNAGYFLGFADAAEFALAVKLRGIAHAPGFPSYILTGYFWTLLAGSFLPHIKALIVFSAACTGAASALLFLTNRMLLNYIYPAISSITRDVVAFCSAISFSTGVTAWFWSSNVEVYTFHVFAFSLCIYGLVRHNIQGEKKGIYAAAAGVALALANHHLTMILFLPFTLFFFTDLLKSPTVEVKQKQQKKVKAEKKKILTPAFFQFAGIAALLTVSFYTWMFIRAQDELPFKFGNPDSLGRLFYHLAGGAWIENTQTEVKGLVALRFPYFMKLSFQQIFLFLPFIVLGAMELFRKRIPKLFLLAAGYYLVVLLYQLRIDQTADTDAYMLPSFFILALLIPFGAMVVASWSKNLVYILIPLLLAQAWINYPETDKRSFNISESLMKELDRSSPKGSVILIADWTTVMQYYYFRIAENFRPDLVVLNYDLKFTNYRILPVLYPEFYAKIKPEYDRFIELLGAAHPQEINNTGCTLDNRELLGAFNNTVLSIKNLCSEKNVAFMCDPKAFVFLNESGLMSNNSYVSGPLVTTTKTGLGKEFLDLNYTWLDSPLLLKEPSASDKMVDLEAGLDFNRNYFRSTGDNISYAKAEASYERIKKLQRKMKRNMPFVYRPK